MSVGSAISCLRYLFTNITNELYFTTLFSEYFKSLYYTSLTNSKSMEKIIKTKFHDFDITINQIIEFVARYSGAGSGNNNEVINGNNSNNGSSASEEQFIDVLLERELTSLNIEILKYKGKE